MTAVTYVLPTKNSIRKNNPLTSSSSSPLVLLSSSSSSLSSSYTEMPQRSVIQPPPPPRTTDDSVTTPKTMACTTTTTTTHHDIFISLTSPTLIKKKKKKMLNDDDDDGMAFRTTTTSDNRTTSSITNRYNDNIHHGTSRCLTPASVQLLRNSLLRTYNQPHTHNMSDHTFNVTSSNNDNSNIRNNRHAPTNDSNDNKNHDTVTANYHYQQQQQHKMKYRTLKRLDTEPIPTVRIKPLSNHHHHNNTSSGTCTSALPASPQRQRRQIFGTFWNTSSDDPLDAPRRHSRSRSNSDVVDTTTTTGQPSTVRKPPSLHTRSKSEGFQYHHSIVGRSILDLNTTKNYYHTSVFTSLPSPMQRLRKSSGGVYPLVQPKSILRSKNNNYHPHYSIIHGNAENNGRDKPHIPDDGSSTNTDYDRSSSISSSTNSIPSIPNETTTAIVTTASHCTGSDCDNNDIDRKPLVHFDPRITITELVGRDHDRVWYSDGELNRFKYETVVTARTYFHQHPDQIVYYNQPFYDPVTKTMRKRALFNLPALANITITEQDDHGPPKSTTAATTVPGGTSFRPATETLRNKETRTSSDGLQQNHQQLLSLLAFENGDTILRTSDQSSSDTNCTSTGSSPSIDTIRSVLIVDHNRWILDLFVRSVRAMFNGDSKNGCGSDAVVVECAPNATVALAIINDTIASRRREPPFDLIIAEQLPPPNQTVQQQSPMADVANHQIGDGDVTALSYPTNSLSLSGAELIFQTLPPEYRQQILLISVAPSSFAKSSNQSAPSSSTPNPNIASVTNTVTSLSDLLWSKPPPRMDHNLCIQLIRTLQKKREQCMGGTNGIQQQSRDVD